jgi:oxygen-independent coproporphyrinogen-3 oxidase
MINVQLINHNFEYDIQQLLLVFFNEINFVKNPKDQGLFLMNSLTSLENKIVVKSQLYDNNTLLDSEKTVHINKSEIDLFIKNYHKRMIKHNIYKLLIRSFKSQSGWGILTGMRPVKVAHKYLDANYTLDDLKELFKNQYFMDEEKISLVTEIAVKERDFIYPIENDKISIYISIPFCITRCSYCSFPSNIVSKKEDLVEPYLKTLKYEIQRVLEKVKEKELIVDSIYIGGGTPSILNSKQLFGLLSFLENNINMSLVKEYTFEAGRPKTITKEKLEVMKEFNVDRICLNPQTLNNTILKAINRDHLSEDIIEKYGLIKSYGFDSINMDLILGLPGQTRETYQKTLNQVKDLKPDNITVHSLAIKRGSKLNNKGYTFEDVNVTEDLMEYSKETLRDAYEPYYMYRQKNIIGNLENVGFSLPGKASLYNIKIIEERHTILAFGAGAVSKVAYAGTDRFERVPNSKGLEDYLDRIDEMVNRKIDALERIIGGD